MHKHWDISQNIFYYVPKEENNPVEVWNDLLVSNYIFCVNYPFKEQTKNMFTSVSVYRKQFITPLLCFYFLFVISYWHVISAQLFRLQLIPFQVAYIRAVLA